MATAWWAPIPLPKNCGGPIRRAPCPAGCGWRRRARGLAERDPQGLRWYLLIAIAVGLVLARGDTGARLLAAFESGAASAAAIDAWVDPPPYTGLPLFSLHAADGEVQVPQGSVLNLRVHGAPRRPGLEAGNNSAPRFAGEDGEYSSNVVLSSTARVRVQVGGHAIGKWRIVAVPDAPPVIALKAKPTATERKATTFSFKGSDDYGIAHVRAVLLPKGGHGKPLVAELPLPESAARKVDQTSYVDLTGHPYAGLTVEGHLEARDAIGQKGLSAPFTFQLAGPHLHRSPGAGPDRTAPASGDLRCRRPQDRDADAGCADHRAGPFL